MPQSQSSVHHCPFLNRDDQRCTENFSLDRLDHALRFCFDQYRSCSTYLQLLVERRVRRIAASSVGLDGVARFSGTHDDDDHDEGPRDEQRLVQLTVRCHASRGRGFFGGGHADDSSEHGGGARRLAAAAHDPQQLAAPAGVPALPRV